MDTVEVIRKESPTRLEKIVGCFLGVVIGDAMGMPWEMMTFKEIMFATRKLGVSGFSHPVQTRISDTFNLIPGDFTDDWQLTRAVARSLIAKKDFDLMDMIKEHLIELEVNQSGFGSSIKKNLIALRDLASGDWKNNPQFHLPGSEKLKGQGAGNGVAMKISPLAIFFSGRHEEFLNATIKLANITHRDPQAMVAAYSLGIMIDRLYQQSIGLKSQEELRREIKELIQEIITETLIVENSILGSETQFSLNLQEVGRMIHNGKIADLEKVRERIGTGCFCAESVPFAMAMFLRHPNDFRAGTIETINCGGDTDSNASMVGALIGTNLGALAIPEEWRTFREEYQEAGDLALNFYNVMYK